MFIMIKALLKIILYTLSVCLVALTISGGILYTYLKDKDGISWNFSNEIVIDGFNKKSQSLKVVSEEMTLRFLDFDDFLYIHAKNIKLSLDSKPLATFKDMRMSVSLWSLIWGEVPVKKIYVDGGILEYETPHQINADKNISINEIAPLVVASFTSVADIMQNLESVELNSIDLRYSVKGTPFAVVSKSANISLRKNKNTVSVEFLGAFLGRDYNKKLIKTNAFSCDLILHDYTENLVGFNGRIVGIDFIGQAEINGQFDVEKSLMSANANMSASDVTVLKYLSQSPNALPTIGGVSMELSTINYNLNKGGSVKFLGIIDEHPIDGVVTIKGYEYADVALSINNVSSDVLNKYWTNEYASSTKNWMHKNIVGTYSATLNTRVDLKNNFAMSSPKGTLELRDALVDYYNPLPVIKIVKATGRYDGSGLYITLDKATVNAPTESFDIDNSAVDILFKPKKVFLKFTANADVHTDTVQGFLNSPAIGIKVFKDGLETIKGRVKGGLVIESNLKLGSLDSVTFDGIGRNITLGKYLGFEKISTNKIKVSVNNTGVSLSGKVAFDMGSVGMLNLNVKNATGDVNLAYKGVVSKKSIAHYPIDTLVKIKDNTSIDLVYKTNKGMKIVDVVASLMNVNINIPALNWYNNAQEKGVLKFKMSTSGDAYKIKTHINAIGEKKLILNVAITGDEKGISSLNVPKFQLGKGVINAVGKREGGVLVVDAQADNVYMKTLRSIVDAMPESESNQAIDITVNMKDVFTDLGIIGEKVSFHFIQENNIYKKIWLHLQTDRPKSRSLIAYDKKSMRLYSENIGALYGFISGDEPVQNGTITMLGKANEKGIIEGNIYIKDLKVLDVPESTRILKIFSILGIFDAIKTKNLEFSTIRGGFRLDKGKYTTENISAIGKNIAVSANGYVDFYHKDLSLKGMILPSYQFGNALGYIPLIGALFAGVDGQGPITQSYAAQGSFSDYRADINSSGIFTIGVLRNIFSTILGSEEVPVIFTEEELK